MRANNTNRLTKANSDVQDFTNVIQKRFNIDKVCVNILENSNLNNL